MRGVFLSFRKIIGDLTMGRIAALSGAGRLSQAVIACDKSELKRAEISFGRPHFFPPFSRDFARVSSHINRA
jgi:hypothetical protein